MSSVESQSIEFPLPPGAWVELYEDINMDEEKGHTASIIFEGTVEQHVPETALLVFEENETTMDEFQELLAEADGYEVVMTYE